MKKQNIWTVPCNGGWAVKKEGVQKPIEIFETKANAVYFGDQAAKLLHSEHTILKSNGQIQDKKSFGNDPYPPKDKK